MIVHEFQGLEEDVVDRRLNRFLVRTTSGRMCHLHDPGRLKELIYPGNRILVREASGSPQRKTRWQVTAAWDSLWVIVDSSIHNGIASHFIGEAEREVKVGESRIDFRVKDTFIEVKGCSLVKDGVAMFPDAPTVRGKRHLRTLIRLGEEGYRAKLMVLVMRGDAYCFLPNEETDRKFAETFFEALEKGVEVEVKTFSLVGNKVVYVRDIPVCRLKG